VVDEFRAVVSLSTMRWGITVGEQIGGDGGR